MSGMIIKFNIVLYRAFCKCTPKDGGPDGGDYLLKAVRVLTAVFWAAARVLGEPCVNIHI